MKVKDLMQQLQHWHPEADIFIYHTTRRCQENEVGGIKEVRSIKLPTFSNAGPFDGVGLVCGSILNES